MSTPYFETVFLTSRDRRAIHAEASRRANPHMVFHEWESDLAPGTEAWRNCDRNIIAAWRALRDRIATRHVLFLEWDVLANCDLTDMLGRPADALAGACLKSAVTDRRAFLPFRELDRLPAWAARHAIGMVPSAVLLMRRDLLDTLADSPRCAAVFAADIISEIRLATLARALGFAVGEIPGLAATVHTTPYQPEPGARGIFHPVKQEVEP